ncbi:MAG: MMPL family transporter [Spirochaetes bacterium]|nr:MMPL family transporter [Spirochaetota bacterium]
MQKNYSIKWPAAIVTILIISVLFLIGLYRINIDTDIISSLPQNDPVLDDGRYILKHHPAQDRIVIDVSHESDDMDALVETGLIIEKQLKESGIFKDIGMNEFQSIFPGMLNHVITNMHVLFSEYELKTKVAPLLSSENISKSIKDDYNIMTGLEGIGQSEFIIRDPLGLKNIILAKLSQFTAKGTQIYRGQLFSSDGRHLLLIANPEGSASDTELSKKISGLINDIESKINNNNKNKHFTLTPVGAYRAALDNEVSARNDAKKAVTLATIGIALLLLFAFPRPLMGLLALLPAVFGTMTALFVYSMINDSVSILAIGFGGALISITVDHGIAYMLFLDQPQETYGRNASKEVWTVGLLATLTTICAFLFLYISSFKILIQIGQFAALGILFSFLFIHLIFPRIFLKMPPAKNKKLPLHSLINYLSSYCGKFKLIAACIIAIVMLFYAKIEFRADLSSMNSVSEKTLKAEELISETWGDIFSNIYLMTEAGTIKELQNKADVLTEKLLDEVKNDQLQSAFTPSMIFPGAGLAKRNLYAWFDFWNESRISKTESLIRKAAVNTGFTSDAFNPFLDIIRSKKTAEYTISENYFPIFGISFNPESSTYKLFSTMTPGSKYSAEKFYQKFSALGITHIFDPVYFSKKLGTILTDTFIKMAVIIGISVIVLLFLFFASIRLTIISILPIAFAFICSLGTFSLLGHSLDIPAIMLSIIIIGMGIDYSLLIVRSYQRYIDENNPSVKFIRVAVFLSAISSLIGFSVLIFSDHIVMKSVGITGTTGIGFSFLGAFLILPALLKIFFKPVSFKNGNYKPGSGKHTSAVLKHFRYVEAYPRLFARFKLMFDPMFPVLSEFIDSPKTIIDIGCGYGVQSVWLCELYPELNIIGFEPDKERARIASHVLGSRGEIHTEKAEDITGIKRRSDVVLILDVIHYINDEELIKTLKIIRDNLLDKGKLIIRVTIPSEKLVPWERWIENTRLKLTNTTAWFRSPDKLKKIINNAGFKITTMNETAAKREETWIVAVKNK